MKETGGVLIEDHINQKFQLRNPAEIMGPAIAMRCNFSLVMRDTLRSSYPSPESSCPVGITHLNLDTSRFIAARTREGRLSI
jgi:hypothetical protein